MTVELERSIDILRPPASVQEVLDDIAGYPAWAGGIDEVEILDDDATSATSATTTARVTVQSPVGPLRAVLRFERDDHGITSRLEEGDMLATFDARYTLTPTSDGARVDAGLALATTSALVPDALLEAYAERVLTGWLDSLKAVCESPDRGSLRGS